MRHFDHELVKQNRGGRKKTEKEIEKEEWDTEDEYWILHSFVPVFLQSCIQVFSRKFSKYFHVYGAELLS